MLIDPLNIRVDHMNTSTKLVTAVSSDAEVNTDDGVVTQSRENRTVALRPDRVTPFSQIKSNTHSAEVNSHAIEPTGDKYDSPELNPAQARWLNMGEKLGTWLADIKSRINGWIR